MDEIRAAIQAFLDADTANPGWQLDGLVIVAGIERVNDQGRMESCAWYCSPDEQPGWQTDGLLAAAVDMRDTADIDTD